MARVSKNLVLQGLRGALGDQIVFKRDKAGRTIVCKKPEFGPDRVFSKAQKAQQGRFREAMAYAKDAARAEPIYAELAEGTPRTAYNVAVRDWFNPPVVETVDASGYSGQAGEVIRARVVDDVRVTRVEVVVVGAEGEVVEEGEMRREQGGWYGFVTGEVCAAGEARVVVRGWDLAGHFGEGEVGLVVD
ncbi:MAG: hypothetical protein GY832_16880 [Chloroflexi bacterium]|nr:hypothetical protein [Chloroflexota bacterium]